MRVLVVEDETLISMRLCSILDDLGAFVMETDTIGETLELLREETFDLVVADVKVPDGTVDVLLGGLRALHPDIPILMVSGLRQSDLSVEIAQPMHWVRKPFTDADIRDAVEKLVGTIARER